MIDPKKLAEWRALCEKATPGPYVAAKDLTDMRIYIRRPDGRGIAAVYYSHHPQWDRDGEFFAASREALPALLDAYENLHRQFDGMRGERDAEREISKQWEEKYAALQVDHCAEVAQWRDWCETIEGRVEAAAQADGASLREENERLREQLRLANLDALTAHLDADKG